MEHEDAALLRAAVDDRPHSRASTAATCAASSRSSTGAPATLAADLTAETFAAALEGCRRYAPERGAPGAWLYAIAHRQLATLHRHGGVERRARRRLGMARIELTDEMLERVECRSSRRVTPGHTAARAFAVGPVPARGETRTAHTPARGRVSARGAAPRCRRLRARGENRTPCGRKSPRSPPAAPTPAETRAWHPAAAHTDHGLPHPRCGHEARSAPSTTTTSPSRPAAGACGSPPAASPASPSTRHAATGPSARSTPTRRRTATPLGSYNVQQAAGTVVTPSLNHGTLTVLDPAGRVLRQVRVAPAAHAACVVR